MKILLCALLLIAVMTLAACSGHSTCGSTTPPPGFSSTSSDILSKPGGTIVLQGLTLFDVYAKKEHMVLLDGTEWNLPCTAELVFTDKQTFVLNTTEWWDVGEVFRRISFQGKMTPGGQLKFTWPSTWIELNWTTMELEQRTNVLAQMRDHMGYELSGPGTNNNTLNYVGYFDGTRLFADFHVTGFQVEPGSMGGPYADIVQGPILVNFSIDLRAAQ